LRSFRIVLHFSSICHHILENHHQEDETSAGHFCAHHTFTLGPRPSFVSPLEVVADFVPRAGPGVTAAHPVHLWTICYQQPVLGSGSVLSTSCILALGWLRSNVTEFEDSWEPPGFCPVLSLLVSLLPIYPSFQNLSLGKNLARGHGPGVARDPRLAGVRASWTGSARSPIGSNEPDHPQSFLLMPAAPQALWASVSSSVMWQS
jgi:hypothetical protein